MRITLLLLCLALGGARPRLQGAETCDSANPPPKADLVIVGTGISGLAAALDAGRAGANVTVIDMWSVFGGHAVMSGGLVCLVCPVETPFQRATNIFDSPRLAIRDFLKHGQDANPAWVRLYARKSKREVYDWLSELGVGWANLFPLLPGNNKQRQHWPTVLPTLEGGAKMLLGSRINSLGTGFDVAASIFRSPAKAWAAWRSISPAACWIVAIDRFPTSTPWVNWLVSVASMAGPRSKARCSGRVC